MNKTTTKAELYEIQKETFFPFKEIFLGYNKKKIQNHNLLIKTILSKNPIQNYIKYRNEKVIKDTKTYFKQYNTFIKTLNNIAELELYNTISKIIEDSISENYYKTDEYKILMNSHHLRISKIKEIDVNRSTYESVQHHKEISKHYSKYTKNELLSKEYKKIFKPKKGKYQERIKLVFALDKILFNVINQIK